MAAERQWSCPICCDDQEDVAYMSPCGHRFCVGCAVRWAQQKPTCPLCRSVTTDISFSAASDGESLTLSVARPAEPSGAQRGSFPPQAWADFFSSHAFNIRPLLPWLRRELGLLYRDQWWEAAAAESTALSLLCCWGLDEEELAQRLQGSLGESTAPFVRGLRAEAERLFHGDVRQHLAQQDGLPAWGEDESPAASPSASRAGTPASRPAVSRSPPRPRSAGGSRLGGGRAARGSRPPPYRRPSPQSRRSPGRSRGGRRRPVPLPGAAGASPPLLAGTGVACPGCPAAPQAWSPPRQRRPRRRHQGGSGCRP